MGDLLITSMRGGQNDFDPAISLADDQCVLARNIEWTKSTLGERRLGAVNVSLAGSPLATCDRIVWSHRHVPGDDESEAQLWLMGIINPSTVVLAYKDTTWHTVAMADALVVDDYHEYFVQGQSLHRKLFIAYKSNVDRLHVWDGAVLRRTGMSEPAAPVVSFDGTGTFTGTRYYRTREVVMDGATVLRRSEPSDVTTYVPSGVNEYAVIVKPADTGSAATHWEVEGSVNNGDFFVLATLTVATTVWYDSIAYSPGYSDAGLVLSPNSGDYTNLPSAAHLTVDRDRLVLGGGYERPEEESRVQWTPVFGDPGVGNDERMELDVTPFLDLNPGDGGPLTNVLGTAGGIWVGKQRQVHKLTSTSNRERAYEPRNVSTTIGAMPRSMVAARDEAGNYTVAMLDPDVGPFVIRIDGPKQAGTDIRNTWNRFNPSARVPAVALYYPFKKQVHWWIAVDGADFPNFRIVLHTDHTRVANGEVRKGWATWTGPSCEIFTAVLFADNIADNEARSLSLRPFVGRFGSANLLWQLDTGSEDGTTEYTAQLHSKPLTRRNLLHKFEVRECALLGKAVEGASVVVTAVGEFGKDGYTKTAQTATFTPADNEKSVRANLDDLSIAEIYSVQFRFEDPESPGERWELELFAALETDGQRAGGR